MRTLSQPVRKQRPSRRRAEQGQAIVEFALVMPILILLLFGVVFFAMAFNLQMVLNAAAREGARAWASNRSGTSPCCPTCIPPPNGTLQCDPEFGDSDFQKNIVPLVKKYIKDNGYDENRLLFQLVQVSQDEIPAEEWNQLEDSAEDATKVKLVILYEYFLPTGGLELKLTRLRAEYTFKRGS